MNKIIFLDRDGTINIEKGYITKVHQLKLYDHAIRAIQLLREMGYRIVIVTNQAGVAKGLLTEDTLGQINKTLLRMLDSGNTSVDKLYYCPHHIEATIPEYKKDCNCRKPKTGMIERAQKELGIDPAGAYMIGDKASDIELAKNFGGKGILVLTGFGKEELKKIEDKALQPVYVATDILDAVEWIKAETQHS